MTGAGIKKKNGNRITFILIGGVEFGITSSFEIPDRKLLQNRLVRTLHSCLQCMKIFRIDLLLPLGVLKRNAERRYHGLFKWNMKRTFPGCSLRELRKNVPLRFSKGTWKERPLPVLKGTWKERFFSIVNCSGGGLAPKFFRALK